MSLFEWLTVFTGVVALVLQVLVIFKKDNKK